MQWHIASLRIIICAGLPGAYGEIGAESGAEGHAQILQEGWDAPEGSRGLMLGTIRLVGGCSISGTFKLI